MSLSFLYHLLISGIIFYIITTGFKFFLKLRLSIDFSYIAIVLFASYSSALLNIHFGLWVISTMILSWFVTIPFTLLIIYLSKKLSGVYFIVWTLALYMFFFQLTINREAVTGGAFGLSGIKRNLIWDTIIVWLPQFLILAGVCGLLILIWLWLFKRTYFFAILTWWGENDTVLKVLWVPISKYTFIMILITSLCAVVWGNLFTFYYLYIDPRSFWLSMLILVLVIAFISYKWWELPTLLIALFVIFIYEYLRFVKIVDPSQLWYLRESIFALAIMITSYLTFKQISFGRQQ